METSKDTMSLHASSVLILVYVNVIQHRSILVLRRYPGTATAPECQSARG